MTLKNGLMYHTIWSTFNRIANYTSIMILFTSEAKLKLYVIGFCSKL